MQTSMAVHPMSYLPWQTAKPKVSRLASTRSWQLAAGSWQPAAAKPSRPLAVLLPSRL